MIYSFQHLQLAGCGRLNSVVEVVRRPGPSLGVIGSGRSLIAFIRRSPTTQFAPSGTLAAFVLLPASRASADLHYSAPGAAPLVMPSDHRLSLLLTTFVAVTFGPQGQS